MLTNFKKFSGILIVAMVAVLLFSGSLAAHEEGRYGGRMIVAFAQDVATFDLQTTTSPPNELRHMIFEPLFAFNADMEPQPILAEEWEYNEEDLYWDIKVREDVEFHDGTPMTSADVVASFERYQQVGARSFQVENVDSVEALDDYTVRFHLDSPFGTLTEALSETSGVFAVYPEWVIEKHGTDELTEDFIGTGPYVVDEIAPEEYYILKRNENYSQPEGEPSFLAGRRNAYVDEFDIRIIEDGAARVAALQAGDVDLAHQIPLDDYEILLDDPNVGVEVTSPGYRVYYKFNSTQGPFADRKLRKAVRVAIDPEDLMWAQGPEDLWRVNHTPRYQEEQWTWSDQSKYFPADMELGRQLVEESDYDGELIRFLVSPGRPMEYTTVMVMEEYLRDLGLNVEINSVDSATFGEVRAQMDSWEIKHAGGGSLVGLTYLGSSANDRTGNKWPEADAEWDYYMNIIETEADDEVRKEAVEQIYRLIGEYNNEFWVGDVFELEGYRNHVRNVPEWFKLVLFNVWMEE